MASDGCVRFEGDLSGRSCRYKSGVGGTGEERVPGEGGRERG